MDAAETHDVLLALWAAICTWQDDVACNLKPTEGSLIRARQTAEKALERNGTPVTYHHVPMEPVDRIPILHLPRATVLSAEPGPDVEVDPVLQATV